MKKATIILLLLTLTGCSLGIFTTKHERKVERAKSKIQKSVKKYPELKSLSTDTVKIEEIKIDTLITKQIDTTVVNKITHDTVTVETERAIVKYKVIRDSVYLDLLVKPDTLIRIDTVYREIIRNTGIINTEKDCKACVEKYWSWFLWIIVVIFAILFIVYIARKAMIP